MIQTKTQTTVKDRLRQIAAAGLFGALAAACQLALMQVGLGIRCPIRLLTGLQCPGCGVSHLVLHLLTGHPLQAFYDNPAIFTELPVLAVILGRRTIRYIRTGEGRFCRWEEIGIYLCIAALLIFGVVRNLP